ncbi:tRNA (adenosine(37)-N6)-threonylcarbamoyltransferase complex ATPase subunit type 1 TsaE [Microbacterium sp. YY-01]|uniref:tRNA (adenosine(37)-N6)-threonylcarbamoyltransferase complex ATPase subunit type 1 TsaE n=1 Tax=Microbacterium sp. YY-01 TaxID=3421634 RepID=UPI003D17AF6C
MPLSNTLLGQRTIATADDMHEFGRTIGSQLVAGDVIILTGPLGAGKTTFTRGLAEGLGVRGPIQSPTFVIARTHPSLTGRAPLVHMDAYRLGSAAELDDLDIAVERSVVVVEWGRGLAEDLADTWWDIEFERPIGGVPDDANGSVHGVAHGDENDVAHGVPHGDASGDAGSNAGDFAIDASDLDADAPRIVTVTRESR